MITALPRREREIFEFLCGAGDATAASVRSGLAKPPSGSAVRTLLGRLEAKGLVRHEKVGQTYVYRVAAKPEAVRESALSQMVRTFFDGSAASAATALLGMTGNIGDDELEALQRAVDEARERRG